MRKGTIFTLFSFLFIVIVIGKLVIVAQAPITGTWTANTRDEKDGKINLSLERRSTNGTGRNQMGKSYDYSELQGLTREQAQNGKVSFSLVREAGTIQFDGEFVNGRGSGTFTFAPNAGFFDAMRSRGFDFSTPANKRGDDNVADRMFAAATLGVTTALADDLLASNFGKLDVDDLFKAAIFKIDGKFMAEMKATGFPNLGMEDLVKARIFKIDADYVRQVHEMGFDKEDFEGLVKFRIFKVTPEFLTAIKNEGLDNLSAEEIVKFRIFNIDPEFVRKAKAENPNVSVEDLVQMKIGVYRKSDK